MQFHHVALFRLKKFAFAYEEKNSNSKYKFVWPSFKDLHSDQKQNIFLSLAHVIKQYFAILCNSNIVFYSVLILKSLVRTLQTYLIRMEITDLITYQHNKYECVVSGFA